MAFNVAGTNALGDYLVSQIQNTRILFGESPATGVSTPVGSTVTGTATSGLPTHSQLAAELSAAQLANTETLFGDAQSSSAAAQGSLPAITGQTSQQVEQVAIQSSLIAQQFANTSTLFSSIGLGANVNSFA